MCSQGERGIQNLNGTSVKNFYGTGCTRKRHNYSDFATKNFMNASFGRKFENEYKRRNVLTPYGSPRFDKYHLKSKNSFDSKSNISNVPKSCLITSEDLAPLINGSSKCKYYFTHCYFAFKQS